MCACATGAGIFQENKDFTAISIGADGLETKLLEFKVKVDEHDAYIKQEQWVRVGGIGVLFEEAAAAL